MLNHLSELNAKKQTSYEQYDSLVEFYKKQCDDSITYYRNKHKNLEYEKDAAVKAAESNNETAYDEALDKWYNSFPSSTKKLAESVLIIEAYLSSPNSVAGCDYWFRYINRSEKTIKYLDWTGVAYNAVDDPVSCDIRLRKTIEGRSTGPIAPHELGGGKWECIIYNYSARTIRLSKIKITYMDGSSKDLTVSNEDVKKMLERPIKEKVNKNSIIKKYDLKFANYNGKVKFWESRRVFLKQTILYISNNMSIDTKNRHYSYYAKNIADLKLKVAERDQYRNEFENFERFLKFEKLQ